MPTYPVKLRKRQDEGKQIRRDRGNTGPALLFQKAQGRRPSIHPALQQKPIKFSAKNNFLSQQRASTLPAPARLTVVDDGERKGKWSAAAAHPDGHSPERAKQFHWPLFPQ
uniref:Uncharacterized protein n=1 Tax=Ditylenchus dipsaci TaxID=166011 RepID=A0A915CYR5_9BILA